MKTESTGRVVGLAGTGRPSRALQNRALDLALPRAPHPVDLLANGPRHLSVGVPEFAIALAARLTERRVRFTLIPERDGHYGFTVTPDQFSRLCGEYDAVLKITPMQHALPGDPA